MRGKEGGSERGRDEGEGEAGSESERERRYECCPLKVCTPAFLSLSPGSAGLWWDLGLIWLQLAALRICYMTSWNVKIGCPVLAEKSSEA